MVEEHSKGSVEFGFETKEKGIRVWKEKTRKCG